MYLTDLKNKPQTFACVLGKYWRILNVFFHWRIRWKFVMEWLLSIPPHLNCVATLPCEI